MSSEVPGTTNVAPGREYVSRRAAAADVMKEPGTSRTSSCVYRSLMAAGDVLFGSRLLHDIGVASASGRGGQRASARSVGRDVRRGPTPARQLVVRRPSVAVALR